MTGMPIGGGNAPGLDGTLADVEELNRIYGDKLAECIKALKDAERILNGIESANMRTFVQMYYIDDISKAEIMRELNMTEWKFNSARQRIEEAESMKKVVWKERFCLSDGSKKN